MQYQVKVESPSDVVRKIFVTISASEITNKIERQVLETQKQARLKGFRPGHAPVSMIRQIYGNEIKSRVYQSLIDESFYQAVAENNLRPVSRPQIDTPSENYQIKDGEDFKYVATFEILPEIELEDYKGITLKKKKIEVGEKDVDEVVENLRNAHAELNPLLEDRPAKMGDFVDFDFKGALLTENGPEEKPELAGHRTAEIGGKTLIEDFEKNLIGVRKGDAKTFEVTFPKDYSEPTYAGKNATFSIQVHEVKTKKLPELNDDFAKEAGYESVSDLKAKAQEAVRRTREDESEAEVRNDLLQQLIKKNKFSLPQSLLQAQLQSVIQEYVRVLRQQGFSDGMIEETLKKEENNLTQRAENQVRSGLILNAIAKKENIKADEQKLDDHLKRLAQEYRMEFDQLKDYYKKNPDKHESLVFRITEELVVKFLLENAKIK